MTEKCGETLLKASMEFVLGTWYFSMLLLLECSAFIVTPSLPAGGKVLRLLACY